MIDARLSVELVRAYAEAAYWKAECEALLAQARGGEPQTLQVIHLKWPDDGKPAKPRNP